VDFKAGELSEEPLKGRAEMRELVLTTLAALERAGLADATRVLHERVFCHRADTFAEPYDENNSWRWRFKPMVELLLLELTDLAEASDLSPDERGERIQWVLEMTGF
jgi:hypothetical protein